MKAYKIVLLSLSILLFPVGCITTSKTQRELKDSQINLSTTINDLDERSRQLTTGIHDLYVYKKEVEPDFFTGIDEIGSWLSLEDQRIEGLPIERIDVRELHRQWTGNEKEKAALNKTLSEFQDQNTFLLKQRDNLQIEINELKNLLEQERNIPWWKKMWKWVFGLSLPSLILVILGVVFAPQFTIPLLGRIVGWIARKIPAFISFAGVVSSSIYDATIKGVQNIKETIKHDPDDKKYTKQEVLQLVNKKLEESHREVPDSEKVVRYRKAKLKL